MPSAITTIWNLNANPYEKELNRMAVVQTAALRRMQAEEQRLSAQLAKSDRYSSLMTGEERAKKNAQTIAKIMADERELATFREYQDREQQRRSDREQAARNIQARKIQRQRIQDRMQGPDLDGSMRARALMTSGPGRVGGIGGAAPAMFVSVMRDTAASLASGANPATVFMQQMPQVMQAMTMMQGGFLKNIKALLLMKVIGKTTLGAMAVGLTAVAVIAGSVWYYFHRINTLVKDMVGPQREAFNVDHIAKYLTKAERAAELQKDINEQLRKTKEAHESVLETMDRELQLVKDQIQFEQELLEIQKQNELAQAKTPAQREAIEKKYAVKSLELRKKEREAEINSMKKTAEQLPAEIEKKRQQFKDLSDQTPSAVQDQRVLDEKKRQADVYKDYFDQPPAGAKDERAFSLDKDRATIAELEQKKSKSAGFYTPGGFSEEDAAKLKAAQDRIKDARDRKKAVEDFENEMGDRNRKRTQVEEVGNQITADEKKLEELTGNAEAAGNRDKITEMLNSGASSDEINKFIKGRAFNLSGQDETYFKGMGLSKEQIAEMKKGVGGKIGDTAKRNQVANENDEKLEAERQKRRKGENKALQLGEVNSLQKVGGGYVNPAQNQMVTLVKGISVNVAAMAGRAKTGGNASPFGDTRY